MFLWHYIQSWVQSTFEIEPSFSSLWWWHVEMLSEKTTFLVLADKGGKGCCILRAVFTRCLWSTGLVRLTRKSSTALAILPLPWLGSGTWKTMSFCSTCGTSSLCLLNYPVYCLLTFHPLSFFSFLDILAWVLGGSARRNTGSASRGGWDRPQHCHLSPSSLQRALVRGGKFTTNCEL